MFKIHGKERKIKKKILSKLKYFVKMFWYYEDINRVYGGGLPDEECIRILKEKELEINELERILSEKIN